jgi:hypothetical protein
MVVVRHLVQVTLGGRVGLVLMLANEARGALGAARAWHDLRLHGLDLTDLLLLPLLLAPPVALWAWRRAARNRRIARRLDL